MLQPPLQHRKQLWVLEMTPLSAGGRKAESKARNSTQQQHLHFYKLIAYTTTKYVNAEYFEIFNLIHSPPLH